MTYKCPHCQNANSVRLSIPRVWEQPLRLIGVRTFRCRSCSRRMYRNWAVHPELQAMRGMPSHVPPMRNLAPAVAPERAEPVPLPDPVPPAPHEAQRPAPAPEAPSRTPTRPTVLAEAWTPAGIRVPRPPQAKAAAGPGKGVAGFVEAWMPAARRASGTNDANPAEETRPRPTVPYAVKSFGVLLAVHVTVGILEAPTLGLASMWVNLQSLVLVIASLLVSVYLFRRPYTTGAAWSAAARLVLQWAVLFICAEAVLGLLVVPGMHGLKAETAFFRSQWPWIWITYAVLPLAGGIGCSSYLFLRTRLRHD